MGLRSANAIICDAGDAQEIVLFNGADGTATLVVGERYRIFAGHGTVGIGYVTPATAANVTGVIGAWGWMDHVATGTSLLLNCPDTTDDFGTDFDSTAYVVKVSDDQ